ncbi:hypothetical protein HanPSC8_Chr01g0034401 [Helianthus annuus]|nr:hypothetical protein HanPSC8_Chr01g0034401 [Helianthus annuus]
MATAGEHDDGVANRHVVYLDTTLDTHLAMIVSDSDTVSDFKRKIMLEHRQLFPAIGDVKVECVKVKRKGSFYHLSDSMLVKSAFGATKRNWFASVDASRLEQNDGIQQLSKHKAGDQLALPWVTHSRSIERHDNHGSPSVHSKTAPLETASLVNQKVLNFDQLTSGDSCKDVSKNAEEDRLCNDKQVDCEPQEKLDTVNTDVNSKKRTRDVHNESPLQDAFGYGPSVKKKRKTQRGKSDVKASEETLALTHDNDKVNDKGDENKRINKGEKCSDLDQAATVLLSIKGVGNETVADVAMVVENNIQQETPIVMSQTEKDSEALQTPTMENEVPSSLMSAPAGVTARGYLKRSTKHKAAENEMSSTSIIKKPHDTNKEATKSSPQQNVGSNGQERADDQIDKHKDDSDISLKQRPELKLPGRKKEAAGCENTGEGKRRKTKKLFKHSDNLVGDISSTGLVSVIDERKTDEVTEEALVDAKKGDDAVMNEVEISVENMEEKSRKDFTDTNESVMNNDADISTTVKNTTQENAQGILDNLEKQNEKTEDATKKKKKRKNKKADEVTEEALVDAKKGDDVVMNEVEILVENIEEKSRKDFTDTNESVMNNDADISTTVKNTTQVNAQGILDNLEKQNEKTEDATKKKKKRKIKKTDEVTEEALADAKKGDDVVMNEVEILVENMEEKSRKDFTDTNESVMNNVADISTTMKNTTQVNAQGILDNLEKQNEKTEDATKKKKKRKNKKTAGRNEDESITKHVNRDVCENVKESESGLLDTDRKDGEREKHEDSERTLIDAKKGDDVIVKEVEVSVENIEEKSRKEITDTNDPVTVTNEDNLLPHSESPVNNDADISTGMNKSQVNVQGILDNVEKQNEKMDDTTKKKRKKKSKTKRSSGRNEDESVTKHVDDDVIENVKEAESSLPDADRKDGDKTNKTDKPQDLQSKHQSTDVELESKKSQSVDHHHLPEKTSKNVTASELSKVNTEVEIPGNESNFFVDSGKNMNTKVDSGNDRSQKLVSKNENSNVSVDVIKDPNITNIDKFKTPKRSRKIDAQKTNRQQLPLVQSRVKTVEKKKVNGLQKVKSLLNTPGTIFGDDGDSDSSTQAPSYKSSSSSSSSSEEDSSYSLYSIRSRSHARKGMEGAGKNNINSQNESKSPILGKLLRSSSAFKKAKVTASQVEDTVESVPDSQP